MKKIVLTIILGCLPITNFAQESDFGNWLIYIVSKQLNTNWNLHHEVQYRNYDAVGDLEQLLLRTGLGYKFNKKLKVEIGYMNQFFEKTGRDQLNILTFYNF